MKSIKAASLLLFMIISTNTFAGDKAEVWSRMYKRAFTPQLKYSVMLSIAELNDRAMIPLLEEVLANDIIATFDEKRSITDKRDIIELTKLIVKELGELKSKDSASLIFNILEITDDPLLKADSIIALGNMRADSFVDDIAFILSGKNLRPLEGISSDFEDEGKVAYACVSALDRFRSIEGYSPVFFASIGWYDQRVRFYADKVLKTIVENPIDSLIPILVDGNFKEKEKALNEVSACKAPAEDKSRAAREALKQGFNNVPDTLTDELTLAGLRKNAIKILYSNKSKNSEDVYYLTESVKKGYDLEEKIYGIRTLTLNNSDEAIESLSRILSEFNQRNLDGIGLTYAEEDVVREIIDALGDSGKTSAQGVLTEVQFSGYPTVLVRKAKEALKKLNQE